MCSVDGIVVVSLLLLLSGYAGGRAEREQLKKKEGNRVRTCLPLVNSSHSLGHCACNLSESQSSFLADSAAARSVKWTRWIDQDSMTAKIISLSLLAVLSFHRHSLSQPLPTGSRKVSLGYLFMPCLFLSCSQPANTSLPIFLSSLSSRTCKD